MDMAKTTKCSYSATKTKFLKRVFFPQEREKWIPSLALIKNTYFSLQKDSSMESSFWTSCLIHEWKLNNLSVYWDQPNKTSRRWKNQMIAIIKTSKICLKIFINNHLNNCSNICTIWFNRIFNPINDKIFVASENILPVSIPCRRQILQELLDVQMKALNPSQTTETLNRLVQNKSNYLSKVDSTIYHSIGQCDCQSDYILSFLLSQISKAITRYTPNYATKAVFLLKNPQLCFWYLMPNFYGLVQAIIYRKKHTLGLIYLQFSVLT